MEVGYARVSTEEQNEARQIKAFEERGIKKVFVDKQSGKDTNRPQLQAMIDFVREDDVVIVESYSRLSRSTVDLLRLVDQFKAKGVKFISLKEQIDTTTPAGEFMMKVFASLADFERQQLLQRQREGIQLAKAEGKYKGKPKTQIDETAFRTECAKWLEGKQTATVTMKQLGLKANTFYRRCKELGIEAPHKRQG